MKKISEEIVVNKNAEDIYQFLQNIDDPVLDGYEIINKNNAKWVISKKKPMFIIFSNSIMINQIMTHEYANYIEIIVNIKTNISFVISKLKILEQMPIKMEKIVASPKRVDIKRMINEAKTLEEGPANPDEADTLNMEVANLESKQLQYIYMDYDSINDYCSN